MAGQRLTDKNELDILAAGDLLMAVDVNDTTGSADGTSKKIKAQSLIVTEKVSIDNSTFLNLATTGVKLVNEGGTSEVIAPLFIYMQYSEGATASTAAHGGTVGYEDGNMTYHLYSNKFLFTSPTYNGNNWVITNNNNVKGVLPGSTAGGKALYFYFGTAPTATATGTVDVWTTYKMIDIS